MRIEIIPCLQDNYSYLIIDESNKSACVVDPSESEPCLLYTSPSPRDRTRSRMPSSA